MIENYTNVKPQLSESAFIHPTAVVIGNVAVGNDSSIWCNAVVRGDINSISIGSNTNIQDNAVLHVGYAESLIIGDNVTVGHLACLHGCHISNNCVIGIGSVIMNGAIIEENCIIGANTFIPKGTVIKKNSIVYGTPFKTARQTTDKDSDYITHNAEEYIRLKNEYKKAAGETFSISD